MKTADGTLTCRTVPILYFILPKAPLTVVVGFTTLLVGVLVLPSTILTVELVITPLLLEVLGELFAAVVEATTLRIWLELATAASILPALEHSPSALKKAG